MIKSRSLNTIYALNFDTVNLTNDNYNLVGTFNCGNSELDRFLQEDALKNNDNGSGVTYLVINKDFGSIIAYYTLGNSSLLYFDNNNISKIQKADELKIRGLSALELKMFAVSNKYQDTLYHNDDGSEHLVSDIILGAVIGTAYEYSMKITGFKVLFLNSVPEAIHFYNRNSFVEIDKYISLYTEYCEGCKPMFLPLFDI